jgi:hypothetical protein
MKRTPLIKKKCKFEGCENYPEMSMKGYCSIHADPEVKTKVITKRQQQARKRSNLSNLKRKVYKSQDKIDGLKSPKNRQNKPIAKISKKMAGKLMEYAKLKRQFMKEHPICECGLPECDKSLSFDVHHTYSGMDRSRHFLDVSTWKAVARKCHTIIHSKLSTEEMIKYGLRKLK